ncbi:hypothetical protein [Nevskia ramosa]|uniref:hypothetical protein n=1 Tax=Nevskia ramosa TaxID=64002 RepID=UPI0003B3A583|nr:hypothetical protein [Nevskia ramosa]
MNRRISENNTLFAQIHFEELNCAFRPFCASYLTYDALATCAVVSPEMHAALCTDDLQRQLLKPGGGYARIYGPDDGELDAALAPDEERQVVADLDLRMISLDKQTADPVNNYTRPDVTRLLLNRRPGDRVVSWGAGERGSDAEENLYLTLITHSYLS